jgi:hypothetical protein
MGSKIEENNGLNYLPRRSGFQKRKGSKLLETKTARNANVFGAKSSRPAKERRGREEPQWWIKFNSTTQLAIPVSLWLSPAVRD